MPPRSVHVNGSVNFADTETVMRELATRIPALTRIVDGERGPERAIFMQFLERKFQEARGLEPVRRAPGGTVVEMDYAQAQLAPGVDPMSIQWPPLGYCAFFEETWRVFQKLARAGVIRPNVRFQVQYSTPLAGVSTYMKREDALRALPSYERALFADLDKLLASIPHERIAVQWDLPLEIGVLEMPEVFAVAQGQSVEWVANTVARCIDRVPADIPVGVHLCYGDAGHRHWKEPTSLATQVELINAVNAVAERPLTWCSFTVPQYVREADFFAPLARLTPTLAEPYLALVPYHPSKQAKGTTAEQIRLVEQHLGQRPWGICTECGLSGVDRGELPALLDLHTQIIGATGSAR